ncbi:HD domain-containing phosphohydrolase [Alkaliphilus peptidifermentans]|uniref:HDIG domain-containing protein n=1 Tax=Alkaliphilus peptidifermentans DSM 18978 TaxID=1120976 RepID=A0A1G5F497_9FIRM|nr:HD domain-containing phosphohydrolase [Alkaliphilus peptidifermentans]SCY34075.1 HDIG domain-containing protein [Alkaliphilus peptidifermentans DSM 18978]
MKLTIRKKITVMVLILILTLVSTLGIIVYRYSKEILIEDTKTKSLNTINNINDYFLKNFMRDMEQVVNYWAQDEDIINYRNMPNQPKLVRDIPEHFQYVADQWGGYISVNPDVAWIYFGVQEDGSILLNPLDPTMPEDYDCRERDWYLSAVDQDGKVIWTDPYLDAGETGEIVVTVAKAVKNENELVGVIGIDIRLNKFTEIIKNLVFGEEGHLMLVSNNGDIYAHQDEAKVLENLSEEAWFNELLLNDTGVNLYKDLDDNDIIVTYLTIPETQWKLIGVTPLNINEIMIPIRNQVMGTALISFIITLFLGYGLSLILTKPVEEIMSTINKISIGEMGVRVNIKSRDEFRILGEKFNEMIFEIESLLKERSLHVGELTEKNKEIMEQNDEILAYSEQTEAMNRELSNLVGEIRNNYLSTVKALANSIEANDRYTRGHCERVRNYALEIANGMGFGKVDLNNLEFASLLHDIGKIGITSEILNKEGKLTFDECQIVKSHPQIAYDILSDVDFLKDSREIIYQHHERFDGNGYPRGLKGDEMHSSAKILAVADAYDAMTSTRPYRKTPLTKEAAIKQLQKGRGTQFDPTIVDVFILILLNS